MTKTSILILGAAVMAVSASAQTAKSTYNATAVLNQYIAYNAPKTPAWQRDIVVEQGNIQEISSRILPPRKVGVSNVCGVYSYRPVTWAELSKADKLSVLQDPNLLSWISWYKAQGQVTVPREIGTPLVPQNVNRQQAYTPPAKPQVELPPIEQTPYYNSVQAANSNAMALQTEKQQRDYAEYLAWKQQVEQAKTHDFGPAMANNTPRRIGATSGVYPQNTLQNLPPVNIYSEGAPVGSYNPQTMPVRPMAYSQTPIQNSTPVQHYQQPVTPAGDIANSPEYLELMRMRAELLNEQQGRATQAVQNINPDMGKYQIDVSPAELYSPNPVYYNLKPSR